MKNPLFKLAWAPAIVLLLHIVATLAGWYVSFWWFDIPLHFLGGMAITLSAYYLLEYFESINKFQVTFSPLYLLLLLAFAALAALCWELMEYAFDTLADTNLQPGMTDTIKDLTVGLIGGSLTALLAVYPKKK